MNYPSLSLNKDSIERAFSERKIAVKKTKTIAQPGNKDNISEPLFQSKNGEIKDCDNCDYKSSTYEDLFHHIKQTHLRQMHKCPLCNFSKHSLSRVKNHLYEVHLKIGTLKKCDECDYENVKGNNLYVHKRQNHMKHLKQKCTACNFTTSYPSKLKQHFNQVHLKIQRKQKMYPTICRKKFCPEFHTKNCKELVKHSLFYCDQCSFSSPRNDSVKSHIQYVHDGVIFKCEECTGYIVKTKSALERHVLSKHPGSQQKSNPIFCKEDECTFVTVVDIDMKRHTRAKHEGVIKYRCNIMNCNYGTESKKAFGYHTKSHTFAEKGSEKKIRKHSNEYHLKYTCKECGFSATSQKKLMQHRRKVHLKVKDVMNGRKRGAGDCELPDKSKFLSGDLQKCDKCEYKSAKFYNMRVHIRKSHFSLKYKCAECDFSHLFPSMVKKHSRIKHLKKPKSPNVRKEALFSPLPLVRALLEGVLKNVVRLSQTKAVTFKSIHTRKKFQTCTECKYSTKHVSSLRKHVMKHIAKAKKEEAFKKKIEKRLEKEKRKEEKGAKEKRTRKSEKEKEKKLKEEQYQKKKLEKVRYCNQCDHSSINSINLKNHKRIHHGVNATKCNMCKFSRTNMKEHIMRKHTGEKPFKCYHCNYSCVTSGHLQSHMRTHAEERPFKCSKCDKAFKRKSDLVKHSKIHLSSHWGIFVEGALISTGTVRKKLHVNSGEKLNKCNQCPYTSSTASSLRNHLHKHSGEKPNKCNKCDYASGYVGALKRHLITHTGEKPNKCNQCDYASSRASHLRAHLKTHIG